MELSGEGTAYQFLVPPMYSGKLNVGLATTAPIDIKMSEQSPKETRRKNQKSKTGRKQTVCVPVGSKMSNFSANALRCTASFHEPW